MKCQGFSLHCKLLRDDQTPLHISARLGKADIVQQLLQQGASPNAATTSGYTPLHLAAREGHEDVASVLLDHGASLLECLKRFHNSLRELGARVTHAYQVT
uniref:Uncharacterized protein n=1 Tax=Pelusios castaneus TaxID=367368 RepID=A0A8C8RKA5_9SAUR